MGTMASNNNASPSEICLKMKSYQLLFAHHISCNWEILQKICTEHGSIYVVLCAAAFQR